ncbi:hypothetical protein HDU80_007417 [Chytriomyces hyalinus]|nr:hypothetical protein HDU80_007417 [Chytriomyces hyalinus]
MQDLTIIQHGSRCLNIIDSASKSHLFKVKFATDPINPFKLSRLETGHDDAQFDTMAPSAKLFNTLDNTLILSLSPCSQSARMFGFNVQTTSNGDFQFCSNVPYTSRDADPSKKSKSSVLSFAGKDASFHWRMDQELDSFASLRCFTSTAIQFSLYFTPDSVPQLPSRPTDAIKNWESVNKLFNTAKRREKKVAAFTTRFDVDSMDGQLVLLHAWKTNAEVGLIVTSAVAAYFAVKYRLRAMQSLTLK